MKSNAFFPIIKTFLLAGIATLSLGGCQDQLDLTSKNAISSASIFQSQERIKGLIHGAYKSLKNSNLYSGRLLMYGDLRGEELIIRTENALTGGYVWENNVTNLTGDVNELWGQLYRVVNNANIIIEGLAKSDGILSDELKKQYIGEAQFIRALAYFHLVTFYGRPYLDGSGQHLSIPLRLKAEGSSANNDLARSTVQEIYDQIIKDLDAAEGNLPVAYTNATQNTTRAHKNTAIAFKTRVYLAKGDFANVRSEAQKLVAQQNAPFSSTNGVTHALHPSVTHIFLNDYTTPESIFSLPMTVADPPSGSSLSQVYLYAPDFVLNNAEGGIYSHPAWPANDARRQLTTEDPTLKLPLLAKFTKRNPAIDYIPVIRYVEVLLNYAEAEARIGNPVLAIALLEAVRHRSDAGYQFASEDVEANRLVETIQLERRIELLGEGLRAFDLLRNLKTFPTKPSLSSFTARAKSPQDEGYIFPLPNSEIITNKLLLD
jgi:hypothetical protein